MAARLVVAPLVTVAASGTKQQLVAQPIKAVTAYISAGASAVYVGDSTVTSTRGILIPANTTMELKAQSMEELALDGMYVDSATSGATVNVSYLSKV